MKKLAALAIAIAGCTNVDAKMDASLAKHDAANEAFKSFARKSQGVRGAAMLLNSRYTGLSQADLRANFIGAV